MQTFMSTDILKFEGDRQDLQIEGLRLYLAIALPMTALTFLAWYLVYRGSRKASHDVRGTPDDVGVSNNRHGRGPSPSDFH